MTGLRSPSELPQKSQEMNLGLPDCLLLPNDGSCLSASPGEAAFAVATEEPEPCAPYLQKLEPLSINPILICIDLPLHLHSPILGSISRLQQSVTESWDSPCLSTYLQHTQSTLLSFVAAVNQDLLLAGVGTHTG